MSQSPRRSRRNSLYSPEPTQLMDLLADLTPSQRQAVTHVDGPLLILAGAGSGKTRVITRRVAYLLRQGVRGENVLAITFTNKAAGEMRERIAQLAPEAGIWVGTFHSLCARLLRSYASLVGIDQSFTIYDQSDRLRLVKQSMAQLGLDDLSVPPERVEAAISLAKNDLMLPRAFKGRGEGDHVDAVAAQVYVHYQERLRESSALDFDDLLLHMVTILREHGDVRAALDRRFRYVLVDEYQDTNLAQYAIVRALSMDHPNLCVTGDPDQSIYGWRGANLNNILEFEKDFPGCKVVKLEQNYRSTRNILAVADHLIRHNRKRKAKALTTENPGGLPVELAFHANELEEARSVASRIVEKVQDGEYGFRDFAVFTRVTALTRNLEAAFRAARVPYQVIGGLSFYERQEIKDVLAYLHLMINPKDDLAFNRVVNVPPRGIGATTLEKFNVHAIAQGIPLLAMVKQASSVAGLKDRAVSALRDFGYLMDELTAWKDHSAEEALRKLLALSGYHAFLKDDTKAESEDRLANLDELVAAAREFDREHPGASIVDFLEEISLASAVDRWSDDGGSVALMTLHAAKGLEFPVVFIVGLEEGLLPHARSAQSDSNVEEERRLLFVGITRAERELYLSACRVREFRGLRQSAIPSRFLRELPHEMMTERDISGVAASPPPSATPTPRRITPTPSISSAGFHLTTAAALAGGTDTFPNPDDFQPGVMVIHPTYGLGKVVAIVGAGPDRKGKINFTVGGERTFVLARSPLRPVSRP